MRRILNFSPARGAGLLLAAIAIAALATPSAWAVLSNRYSFTTDASDSVGGMNAVVVDAGVTPNFTFAGGQIDLSANTGQGSNVITEDAYVDLPNGLISSNTTGGTNGAVSMEFWATISEIRTWSRLGDFGTSNEGEDTSAAGDASDYVLIAANSGRYGDGFEITNHPATNAAEPNVGRQGAAPVGVQQHVVAVYDHNDPTGGGTQDGTNGTMALYVNGALIGKNGIHPDINLRTFNDENNWLGRSQWNDPIFDGSYNEFRVYDHALQANEVLFNNLVGPDVATPAGDLLSLRVDPVSGQVQIENNVNAAINIDYYKITSPTGPGALSTAGWNSLADQDGQPAPGEGWDESGGSDATQLIELYLGDPNGALSDPFAANGTRSLGGAFQAGNSARDLTFEFGVDGSADVISGTVTYGPIASDPIDLSGNGRIDGRDFILGQRGANFATFVAGWEPAFGSPVSTAVSAAVPEPATGLGILILAACGLASQRRRAS